MQVSMAGNPGWHKLIQLLRHQERKPDEGKKRYGGTKVEGHFPDPLRIYRFEQLSERSGMVQQTFLIVNFNRSNVEKLVREGITSDHVVNFHHLLSSSFSSVLFLFCVYFFLKVFPLRQRCK